MAFPWGTDSPRFCAPSSPGKGMGVRNGTDAGAEMMRTYCPHWIRHRAGLPSISRAVVLARPDTAPNDARPFYARVCHRGLACRGLHSCIENRRHVLGSGTDRFGVGPQRWLCRRTLSHPFPQARCIRGQAIRLAPGLPPGVSKRNLCEQGLRSPSDSRSANCLQASPPFRSTRRWLVFYQPGTRPRARSRNAPATTTNLGDAAGALILRWCGQ